MNIQAIVKKEHLLAAGSGILLSLGFPKWSNFLYTDWVAYIALVPLFFAISCRQKPAKGFITGFVFGFFHFSTLIYWVFGTMQTYGRMPWYVAIFVLVLFSAYLALYPAVFTLILTRLQVPVYVFPFGAAFLWTGLEFCRAHFFTGFPWELLGYTQYRMIFLIQIADILGVYGISFLVVLTNAAVFLLVHAAMEQRKNNAPSHPCFLKGHPDRFVMKRIFAVLSVLFFLYTAYGLVRVHQTAEMEKTAPRLRVSLIQGNIAQKLKWDKNYRMKTLEKYILLSHAAIQENPGKAPELVVWPESATPFYFLHNMQYSAILRDAVRKTGAAFLFGSPSFIKNGREYVLFNSAYLLDKDALVKGKYNKAHLVPYGEYVPLRRYMPFLGKIVAQVGDFHPGKPGETLIMKDVGGIGVQICYEIIFPGLSAKMVQNGAVFLANLTNDAWYGYSSAPYQHFSMTVMRAVENKRALVRAANTGISGFIGPCGNVIGKTPLFTDAYLTKEIPLLAHETLYTRYGDLFAWACVILSLGLLGFSGGLRKE